MAVRVIFKYEFTSSALFAPDGEVRLVAHQGGAGVPTLWIEHDDGAPAETVYYVRATGEAFEDSGDHHVGSAICGPFVWHVYKRVGL